MLRMCRHLLQAGLAWILYVTLGSPLLAAEIVLVNRPESPDDRRYEYPETLLQAILDRTAPEYGPARVERAAQVMSRERIFAALKHTGNQLHVLAEAPKPGWEEALIPIRIPIRKGIQGYRVFLIKRAHQPLLEKVHSLEALAALPTGAGAQWSTAPVMTAAGFNVVLGSSYE
ncbi:MAG: hypothetical protein LPK85_13665, partial [Gammaproteobacteria bacterium]|nr:hypothetical protein [Gammaproteobacteria bacterium]